MEQEEKQIVMKKCNQCGTVKEHTAEFFNRNNKLKSGFVGICKDCRNHPVIKEQVPQGMQKCGTCEGIKELTAEFFGKTKQTKSGFIRTCKECTKKYRDLPENKKRHKETMKKYHAKPENILSEKLWRDNYNKKPEVKLAQKQTRELPENKKHRKEYKTAYDALPENKEASRKYRKEYSQKPENKLRKWEKEKARRKNNPLHRLKNNLGKSLNRQLKTIGVQKTASIMKYIGCSREALQKHLNLGEYTLGDYSKNEKGQILFDCDHIIPSKYFIAKIKRAKKEGKHQEAEAWIHNWWNYRNLRIWSSSPNRSKGGKIDKELIRVHGVEDLLTL